jgi:hypothetical protein
MIVKEKIKSTVTWCFIIRSSTQNPVSSFSWLIHLLYFFYLRPAFNDTNMKIC